MSPRAALYAYAAVVAAGFAFLLAQIPVQVSDCLIPIATAFTSSWGDLFAGGFGAKAFLRPLIHPQTKLVLEVARGHEFAAFRAVQIVQVFAAFWLFARALRVRTWPAVAGALVGIAVFSGSHTFATLVREGYPINTYLTVTLCGLVALNILTEERSRRWTDAVVIAAFVLAVGTIENGLLIWVAVGAGMLAGYRGVSRGGVAALTVLTVGYFVLRFAVLDIGTPNLLERSSGFWFERLEPAQLVERFGANPLPLYAYNVASALSTVLFGEPRNGLLVLGRAVVDGSLRPWMILDVLSGTAATLLIGWYAWSLTWRRSTREWTGGQRLLAVAAAVVVANAVMRYAYAKDEIMTPSGPFFAAAVAVSIAGLAQSAPRAAWARAVAVVLVAVAAIGWSWRVAGVQHGLAHAAFTHRNDWAAVDPRRAVEPFGSDPALLALIRSIRQRALTRPTAYPGLRSPQFVEEWFDH
jgi:hypothetical protein